MGPQTGARPVRLSEEAAPRVGRAVEFPESSAWHLRCVPRAGASAADGHRGLWDVCDLWG